MRVIAGEFEGLLDWNVVASVAVGIVNLDFGDGSADLNSGAALSRTAPARGFAHSLIPELQGVMLTLWFRIC